MGFYGDCEQVTYPAVVYELIKWRNFKRKTSVAEKFSTFWGLIMVDL